MTNILEKSAPIDVGGICVGRIVEINAAGRPLVDFPFNQAGPIEARVLVNVGSQLDCTAKESMPVLLVFENSDPGLPIIVGFVYDQLCGAPRVLRTVSMGRPQEAVLDGRRVVLQANEEVVIGCGKSSIILRKDGKIVLKGTQIISRASGTNKIKGAAVMIN